MDDTVAWSATVFLRSHSFAMLGFVLFGSSDDALSARGAKRSGPATID